MAKDELITKFEEVSLVYKNKTKAKDRITIKSPDCAFKVFIDTWDENQINLVEEFKILLLDRHLRVMSLAEISKGGFSETVVDPRMVFSIALKRRANRIIMAHNHPSQGLKPSRADVQLTKTFIEAGKILRIPVEDHLIITQDGYTSLLENGAFHNEFE